MRYALNLANDGRILSACVVLPNGSYNEMPIVETLPTGETAEQQDIHNWLYVDGEYVFAPLPTQEEIGAQKTTDQRLTELEEAFEMILSGVVE